MRARIFTLLLSTVGLVAASAAAARADLTSCVYPAFNAQTASDAALQACGFTKLPLSSTTPLPGGGVSYNYNFPDGGAASYPQTPPGFDALTASPSVDAAYGVPPEPAASSPSYAAWKSHVANWQLNPGASPYIVMSPVTNGNGIAGPFWAGYQQPANNGWVQAEADYNEPQLGTTSCSNSEVSFWDGIGNQKNALGQDGTTTGAPGWAKHSAFYENLPDGELQFMHNGNPVTASESDPISAITQYAGGGSYEYTIYIGSNVYVAHTSGKGYDGSVAEEIVERPLPAGWTYHAPLLNFNYVNMTGLNGVNQIPLGSNASEYDMGNFATTGTLNTSTGHFKVTQNSCGG